MTDCKSDAGRRKTSSTDNPKVCLAFSAWRITSLLLVVLLLFTAVGFISINKKDKQVKSAAVTKTVLAADIYKEFTCPCCGQPLNKENPCCSAMVQMIDYIDQQIAAGLSSDEVMLATVRRFGLDRLARVGKRNEIKALLISAAPANAPKIVVSTDTYDFGNISQAGGVVSTDFELRNIGKSDLVIEKLSSSCGCTSASIVYHGEEGPKFTMEGHGKRNPTDWRVVLEPSDKAILRVYYDPTVHQDLTGPVTRTVSVFSNDPVEFEKKVIIKLNQVP